MTLKFLLSKESYGKVRGTSWAPIWLKIYGTKRRDAGSALKTIGVVCQGELSRCHLCGCEPSRTRRTPLAVSLLCNSRGMHKVVKLIATAREDEDTGLIIVSTPREADQNIDRDRGCWTRSVIDTCTGRYQGITLGD